MTEILDIARWYVANGVSVIPVKADGSKAPLLSGWRKYAASPPTDDELVQWFGGGKLSGIGVPCGAASGNLVVLDFECDQESAYTGWLARLPDELREEVRGYPTVTTPSGGKHVWVRLAEPQPGGKLARYAGGKTKIEVRGDGHQVLAPGCPAECHKTRRLYEWDVPPGDADPFPVMDAATWAALCGHAAACNEYMAPEQPRDREPRGTPAGAGSPGNDFNARGSWADTGLFDSGWTWHHKTGDDRGFLTRPGKESGISASVGQVSSRERGYPYLYVWSTSTPDFASETPYSRFAVYAILKHQGDFSAAAKELARLGYGERPEFRADTPTVVDLSGFCLPSGFRPFTAPAPSLLPPPKDDPATEPRIFKWSSELSAQADDAMWIWDGYLLRGGITLFSAHPKAGKTTMLSHLLKALGGSAGEFLGQPVRPSRVLIVSEENESIWANRRDDLGLGDHVGYVCQPFKGRCTMPEWRAFVQAVADSVSRFQFDLVVVDTLAKMWPVREENDASQVDEAMMPLWLIAKAGASVLVIHHSRKSGGAEFTSVRGSSALAGFTEIIMEFRRNSDDKGDRKRVIKAVGRLPGIPEEKLIELRPEGYVNLGDPGDSAVRAAHKTFEWADGVMEVLREALDRDPDGWVGTNEVIRRVKEKYGEAGRKSDVRAYLDERQKDGEVEMKQDGQSLCWRLVN